MSKYRLCDLKPGEKAYITDVCADESMKRRFFDIGLIKNTCVECVGKSPLGDPCAYLIRGAVIAIRKRDGMGIEVADSVSVGAWGYENI